MSGRPHEGLDAWDRGIDLVEEIYRVTKDFPEEEKYGVVSQLRRAVVSVPTNIAEGAGRRTSGDYIRFLFIASGSISEVETLLTISERLGYIGEDVFDSLREELSELSAMIGGLVKYLEGR